MVNIVLHKLDGYIWGVKLYLSKILWQKIMVVGCQEVAGKLFILCHMTFVKLSYI